MWAAALGARDELAALVQAGADVGEGEDGALELARRFGRGACEAILLARETAREISQELGAGPAAGRAKAL